MDSFGLRANASISGEAGLFVQGGEAVLQRSHEVGDGIQLDAVPYSAHHDLLWADHAGDFSGAATKTSNDGGALLVRLQVR